MAERALSPPGLSLMLDPVITDKTHEVEITLPTKRRKILNHLKQPVDDSSFFDLTLFTKQCTNRYDEDCSGPFTVYIFDLDPTNNLGNAHPLKVGIKIFKHGIKLVKGELFKLGPKKFGLIFNSGAEANNFVESQIELINPSWEAFIPDAVLFKVGIMDDVPSDILSEDLLQGLSPSVLLLSARLRDYVSISTFKVTH